MEIPADESAPGLLLVPELVLLGEPATTDEGIIRRLSEHLYRNGMVHASHADATVERERVYPTGLELGAVNAALPHTDAEHVVHNAIAVAVPTAPITFHHMADPDVLTDVGVVIMLAINHKDGMVPLLARLALMLQDGTTLPAMASATSPEQLVDAFRTGIAAAEPGS